MIGLTIFITSAFGQTYGAFDVLDNALIDSSFISGGAGAPSIQWDPVEEEYVMAFHNPVATTPGVTCNLGPYEVRFATATDLLGPWTLLTEKIGVNSVARPCGGMSPSLVIQDDGDWFVAYNKLLAVNSTAQAGVARKLVGQSFELENENELDGLWDMDLIFFNDTWHVWGVDESTGDLMLVTSTGTSILAWNTPTVSVDISLNWWTAVHDGISSLSTSCIDATDYAWPTWMLGVDINGDTNFGYDLGRTNGAWYTSGAEYTWTTYTNATWRDLDYITEYSLPNFVETVLLYEDVDANGDPKIGIASDGDGDLVEADILDRDCDQ